MCKVTKMVSLVIKLLKDVPVPCGFLFYSRILDNTINLQYRLVCFIIGRTNMEN